MIAWQFTSRYQANHHRSISHMKHPIALVLALLLWPLSAMPEPTPSIEVRLCPASAVETYPLESRREVNGLLLQNVAILVPRPIQSGDVVIAK